MNQNAFCRPLHKVQSLAITLLMVCSTSALAGPTDTEQKSRVCIATSAYHTSTAQQSGLSEAMERIISEAYAYSNYQVEFRALPHKRALQEVLLGQCDMMGGAIYSDKRAESYLFSKEPIAETDVVLFTRKDNPISWTKLEDLVGYRIGYGDGHTVSEEFDQADYLTKIPIASDNRNTQIFYLLASGRIDLAVMAELQGRYIIATRLPTEYKNFFTVVQPPISHMKVYGMFSRAVSDVERKMAAFDQGLEALKASGEMDKIIEEYIERNIAQP
ncbi:substrate-binding periplasmic protein [Halioxenophilus sp. WMMB6]|uniref:substrate-binding periplasmic protein n=1 Tax=Halioxenophilus sp. WMMB6 TaxID=3073815 RepID=UPI00295E4FCA|nr:transporter substrate-binding domain-containing protein [Halioxenophilus sp. WMMB6]